MQNHDNIWIRIFAVHNLTQQLVILRCSGGSLRQAARGQEGYEARHGQCHTW